MFEKVSDQALSCIFDTSFYSLSALENTITAYQKHCTIETAQVNEAKCLLTITPLLSGDDDVRTMVLEFWNYFLDRSCQEKLV